MFGRKHVLVGQARTLHLTVKPTARGRGAVQHRGGLRVFVKLTFTPRGGTARTVSFRVRVG